MAIEILRMDPNLQYASHYGTGSGYGPFQGYDPYARQTQMPSHRGPPLHARQPHGYFGGVGGGYGRPHHAFKSPSFTLGGVGSKRKFDYDSSFSSAASSQAQGQPALHQLRADNLKKTRRHFQGSLDLAASTPRIAPKAPDNRHGFLLSAGSGVLPSSCQGLQGALHAVTPSAVPGGEEQLWKNSYGNADKEAVQLAAAAGLDFLGSFYDDAAVAAEDDDFDTAEHDSVADGGADVGADVHETEQPPHTFDEEASFPPQAKRKLASQAAYIAQLEEQALTYKERIFLLEQQLAEARRRHEASPSGQSGGDPDVTSDDTSNSDE